MLVLGDIPFLACLEPFAYRCKSLDGFYLPQMKSKTQHKRRAAEHMFRVVATAVILLGLQSVDLSYVHGQESGPPLDGEEEEFPLPHLRWVGIRQNCCPTIALWMEFYPDSMLLINDVSILRTRALKYRITEDSIVATGDTLIRLRYELVLDRLILYTPEGLVITMAPQSRLARPIFGAWIGTFETDSGSTAILLQLFANGNATWRRLPNGESHSGEWDKNVRTFRFTWDTDSVDVDPDGQLLDLASGSDRAMADSSRALANQWIGYHDPFGNALQFRNIFEGSGSVIFRKKY